MKVATIRVMSVGEVTQWGKQFLGLLQSAHLIEITFIASFQSFCESTASPGVQVLFVENTPESRSQVIRLRQLGRRIFIVWYGRNFTKEDMVFAHEHRIYC